jgi:DNA polymerase-3 subunit epsilon
LCKRLGVDNSGRDLHGALLDANLLAEVYLALTAGQGEMSFEAPAAAVAASTAALETLKRGALRVLRASVEELAVHEARLDGVAKAAKKLPVWRELES